MLAARNWIHSQRDWMIYNRGAYRNSRVSMYLKTKIRKTSVVALLVLSMLGFGIQTFESVKDAECRCAENLAGDSGGGNDAESCCSQTAELTAPCCCNPNAAVCKCEDCQCGQKQSPDEPLPAIPVNETNEVVSPTLICAAPPNAFPHPCELQKLSLPKHFSARAVLSSQQTCVLLSRFTC